MILKSKEGERFRPLSFLHHKSQKEERKMAKKREVWDAVDENGELLV